MKTYNIMKKIILAALILTSCGPRTGIHDMESFNDEVQHHTFIDTGVVKSISLTSGKYQSFRVSVHKLNGKDVDIVTKTLDFNVDDSLKIETVDGNVNFYRIKR
jgi:hypothetical protein